MHGLDEKSVLLIRHHRVEGRKMEFARGLPYSVNSLNREKWHALCEKALGTAERGY